MKLLFLFSFILLSFALVWAADPTNYEYYTSGGIKTGIDASTDQFALNGKHIVLLSGSFHYFRVVANYWKPILARFRAAGLNTVELYLPWNLHEETKGKFDFTTGFLNLAKFLDEIKEADMFAIVRIGPYICAEWEWGGFPAWLYREQNMTLRTNNKPYLDAVASYWTHVMKIINEKQFTGTHGGPIIMLQIENEYYGSGGFPHNRDYLVFLHDFVHKSGFKELLFTSDPNAADFPIKDVFPAHDVLETLNGNHNLGKSLTTLKQKQTNRPGFVSEFWPGWFDLWGNAHHARYSIGDFEKELHDILFTTNSSVNFYMFIGGTNFGFMNGGRIVTSYDYDAPLSESGNYTAKYHKTREIYQKMVEAGKLPKIHLPEVPKVQLAHAYPKLDPHKYLPYETLVSVSRKQVIPKPVHMELLPEGQNFGFIIYRAEHKEVKSYEITGPIHDRSIFLVDGEQIQVIEEKDAAEKHFTHNFTSPLDTKTPTHKYDILVENQGRVNYGIAMVDQHKGISADIKLDGVVGTNFTAFSLDFKEDFMAKLHAHEWKDMADYSKEKHQFPAMYSAVLNIVDQEPQDTFLSLPGWTKGNVFVNGFNIGRYWSVGPTKTLYLPAPLLHKGQNAIDIFELHKPGQGIVFLDHPVLE